MANLKELQAFERQAASNAGTGIKKAAEELEQALSKDNKDEALKLVEEIRDRCQRIEDHYARMKGKRLSR